MRNHIGNHRIDFYTIDSKPKHIFCSNSLCSYVNIYYLYQKELFRSTSSILQWLFSFMLNSSNKSLNCQPALHKAESSKIDLYQKHASEKPSCQTETAIGLIMLKPSVLNVTQYMMLLPKPFQSQNINHTLSHQKGILNGVRPVYNKGIQRP